MHTIMTHGVRSISERGYSLMQGIKHSYLLSLHFELIFQKNMHSCVSIKAAQ